MTHYCTYFDGNYLTRGLTLYHSMLEHCQPFQLHVLCMDDEAYNYFAAAALPQIQPIRLVDFEAGDEQLAVAKGNRSLIEYYFTCTPSLPLYVMRQEPTIATIVYIDADFFFFHKPDAIEEALANHPLFAVEHRFPPELQHHAEYGRFNVGILGFRNDAVGRACLERWREQCLEWCYDRLEGDRFGDQKYLDEWPARYPTMKILYHPGVNLAPWNLTRHKIEWNGNALLADGRPVICFHFHGLKEVNRFVYITGLNEYRVRLTPAIRKGIFQPYLKVFRRLSRHLRSSNIGIRSLANRKITVRHLIRERGFVVALGRFLVSGG